MHIAFFASGAGSSLRAIVAAIDDGALDATPVLLISNRREAPALAYAAQRGLAAVVIPTVSDPGEADRRALAALEGAGAEWVVLSGYLRKLGPAVLARYAGRILNVHPALLPRHGGPGMYGRRVHEAVAASGDAETGATIHLVDGEYDHGPVVAQARLAVGPGETPDSIERRVTALEPRLFVDTLRRITRGELPL